MSDVGRMQLSSLELSEKLHSALADYEHYVRRHQMKTVQSPMHVWVSCAIDVLTGNWKDLGKDLFSLYGPKTGMSGNEIGAPGREVAYLSLVHERLE